MSVEKRCDSLASGLEMLVEEDRCKFVEFGFGDRTTPRMDRIHHAFEQWVAVDPERTAVESAAGSISYGDLNDRAEAIASELIGRGVREGEAVGLFLSRSIEMIVGILGILKAGAAYVPQDARIAPAGHLLHIVETARIDHILTASQYLPLMPTQAQLLAIDRLQFEPKDHGVLVPRASGRHGLTAAIVFTSGTTGKPNGVQITHANLVNTLLDSPASLTITAGARVAQILNISFDMAIWEILGSLVHGATLVIRGASIQETISQVDVAIATPSIVATLNVEKSKNLKVLAVAGERCPQTLVETWSAFCDFYNACGPTEVSIVNTIQAYPRTKTPGRSVSLSVGRPLPNNSVYILDSSLNPLPIGAVGEVWAGGACVSAGYVGNTSLTAERFVQDPFMPGGRMFRTRDLGAWNSQGELEIYGRTDDQVKVRGGFRVELDAVTTAMEAAQKCQQATTILHEGQLWGFVVPETVELQHVVQAVEHALPYYCVPHRVVGVDSLPLTSRGKIDKRQLMRLALDLAGPSGLSLLRENAA